MNYQAFKEIPKVKIMGGDPPLEHTLRSGLHVTPEECAEAVVDIYNGKQPKEDAWWSICERVSGQWGADTGGSIYTMFYTSLDDAKNSMIEYEIKKEDYCWSIEKWGDKAWVLIWWYRHEDMIEMGNTQ